MSAATNRRTGPVRLGTATGRWVCGGAGVQWCGIASSVHGVISRTKVEQLIGIRCDPTKKIDGQDVYVTHQDILRDQHWLAEDETVVLMPVFQGHVHFPEGTRPYLFLTTGRV